MTQPYDPAEMWEALKAVKADSPTAHIACTMEWLDKVSRNVEPDKVDWPSGPLGVTAFGTSVYVTDDVTDPRGWEARPGASPAEAR